MCMCLTWKSYFKPCGILVLLEEGVECDHRPVYEHASQKGQEEREQVDDAHMVKRDWETDGTQCQEPTEELSNVDDIPVLFVS